MSQPPEPTEVAEGLVEAVSELEQVLHRVPAVGGGSAYASNGSGNRTMKMEGTRSDSIGLATF